MSDWPDLTVLPNMPIFLDMYGMTEGPVSTKAKADRFEMRVDPEWLELIDDLRRHEKDVPTRAEYLRRLAMREFQRLQPSAA